ncbi:MAG: hypothetical protein IJU48_03045 [Synergistaceae bacterium]|nr:hypothetical protein [Synergistaceae bacterium]
MKRKFSILLLSALIMGLLAGSAFAATAPTVKHYTMTFTANSNNIPAFVEGSSNLSHKDLSLDVVYSIDVKITSNNVTYSGSHFSLSGSSTTIPGLALNSNGFRGAPTAVGTNFNIKVKIVSASLGSGNNWTVSPVTVTGKAPTIAVSMDSGLQGGAAGTAANAAKGLYLSTDKKPILGGTALTKDNTPFVFVTSGSIRGLTLTAKISPSGSPLSFVTDAAEAYTGDGASGSIKGYLTGTVPNPGKDGIYTVTVTAKNAADKNSVTKYYSFDVMALPKIKTAPSKAVTYGKAFSLELKPTQGLTENKDKGFPGQSWDIVTMTGAGYMTSDDLALMGLSFNRHTGKIEGTWESYDKPIVSFDSTVKTVAKKLRVVLSRDNRVCDSTDITLTFTPVKPVINTKANDITNGWGADFYVDVEASNDNQPLYYVEAQGPGKITWTVANLPDGLSYDWTTSTDYYTPGVAGMSGKTANRSYLRFHGTPTKTQKATAVTITATNSAGSVKISPKFTVGAQANFFNFDDTSSDHTMGAWAVGQNVDEAALDDVKSNDAYNPDVAGKKVFGVTAGPVKWSATDLPKGIKLVASGDTQAYLSGKFSKATEGKWVRATITAENKALNLTKSITYDYRIFELPVISTKKLGNNNDNKMAVATKQEWTLELKNDSTIGDVTSWDIVIGGADSNDKYVAGENDDYYLQGDSDGKIVGSLDRVPDNSKGTVTIKATATNPAGSTTKTFEVTVTGSKPTFTSGDTSTLALSSGTENTQYVTISGGTLPVTLSAYVDAKQAKKLFGLSSAIDLSQEYGTSNPTGFVFEPNEGDETSYGDVRGTLTYLGDEANKHYDDLKITINAENAMTGKKPVVHTITVDVTGTGIGVALLSSDASTPLSFDANTTEQTVYAIAGKPAGFYDDEFELIDYAGYALGIQGSDPLEITYPTGNVNGLTMVLRDPQLVDSDRYYKELYVSGTPKAGSTTKSKFKVTVKDPTTNVKSTYTLLVHGLMPPEMKSKAADLKKEVGVRSALNIAPKASGYESDTQKIKWQLDASSVTGDYEDTDDIVVELRNYGIEFTSNDGKFASTSVTNPTLDDNDEKYEAKTYYIRAKNIAGYSSGLPVVIGIQGQKPTLKTAKITISRSGSATEFPVSSDLTPFSGTEGSADVKYALATTKDETALSAIGLELEDTDNQSGGIGKFTGTPSDLVATKAKGTNINLTLSNFGMTNKGKLAIVVNDPDPAIEGDSSIQLDADAKKVTGTVDLNLTDATQGTTKNKWEITKTGKPTTKGITAAIKANKDAQGAVLTITVAAKFNPNSNTTTVTDSVTVRVTNPETKASADKTIAISVVPYNESTSEAPEDEAKEADEAKDADETEAEAEEELAKGEGDVVLGEARTEAALTAGERAAIAAEGYMIAAVLPEVTVTEDGLYDLDAVALVEEAPEGAELVWFAFPRNAAASEDDEIAEFYDEAGAEIEVVPAERKVVPAAWFNADVTYAPVIAVKVPATEETKDTAEDAEAGDVVTLEALEAAE